MVKQVGSILLNLWQLLSDICYYPGSFVVDSSSTVIEERRRLSYRPQCTGMEERLVNCTQIYTQCEGDRGERVVISCWNISRDSSHPVTTHTLVVQTSTITSIATVPSSVSSTVPSSVSSAVPSSVMAIETGSVSKVPSFTPYIPTNPATEATSDTGGQLVVCGSVASVAGVVTVGALVLVLVLVVVGCTVWRKRKGHRRSDGQCLFISRCSAVSTWEKLLSVI